MAVSRRSPGRLSSAGEERTLRRVVIVERDAHQRALLGEELSRRDFAVQGLSDEQVLLDTPGALRHADVIVLGQTRSIASALSLSVRLNDAGIRVPIVNLTGRQTARSGSGESADHVGPALRIDDMLTDLKQLVRTIRQHAGPPSGDVVRGALTLRSDGTALWKDIEVPLTPAECEIVRLLVQSFPQFVSYDKIYALGRDGRAAAVPDEHERRIGARLAVRHIRRKFRDCDPTFRGIKSHSGLGYGWNGRAWPAASAGQVIDWPRKR